MNRSRGAPSRPAATPRSCSCGCRTSRRSAATRTSRSATPAFRRDAIPDAPLSSFRCAAFPPARLAPACCAEQALRAGSARAHPSCVCARPCPAHTADACDFPRAHSGPGLFFALSRRSRVGGHALSLHRNPMCFLMMMMLCECHRPWSGFQSPAETLALPPPTALPHFPIHHDLICRRSCRDGFAGVEEARCAVAVRQSTGMRSMAACATTTQRRSGSCLRDHRWLRWRQRRARTSWGGLSKRGDD